MYVRPTGFVALPPPGPGDACDRKTDVRTACSPCPGCHLGGALGAHRTVIEEHSVVNAQRVDLGTVGVRHEGCQEVI